MSDRVYEAILERLLDGYYEVGDRLVETEVADELGTSRTPVREALRRLASEGVVEFNPNRGSRVAVWSEQEVDEILEIRSLLESYAAKLAAIRIDKETLLELNSIATQMEDLASGSMDNEGVIRMAVLNGEFHMAVVAASGNKQLGTVLSTLILVPRIHRTYARYTGAAWARSLTHHRELINALDLGEPAWAESVMRAHILSARSTRGSALTGSIHDRDGPLTALEITETKQL